MALKFKQLSSGGSGSGVVVVDELPTENIQEGVIYQVNEISDIDVYLKDDGKNVTNLEYSIKIVLGKSCTLIYDVVESLPSIPNVSDLQTFSPAYVYIYNDTPYVYGNAGNGDMWIDIMTLIASVTGKTYENKGYISNPNFASEAGLYVRYTLGKQCILNKEKYEVWINENSFNINYEEIFNKTIKEYYNPDLYIVPLYAFAGCLYLKKVILPNTKIIMQSAFRECDSLKNLYLGGNEVVVLVGQYHFYLNNVTVHVRPELLSAYQSDEKWANAVSNGNVTLVGDYVDE